MKKLLLFLSVIFLFSSCQLAPVAESWDMFLILAFCYLPPWVWFYFGWKASKSGSLVKKGDGYPGGYHLEESDENVPFTKTGQFWFGIMWLVLGSGFFWAIMWPDHHDVWFILNK